MTRIEEMKRITKGRDTRKRERGQSEERQRTVRLMMRCGRALFFARHVVRHLEPCRCMCAKNECTNVRENTRVRVSCSHESLFSVLFLKSHNIS